MTSNLTPAGFIARLSLVCALLFASLLPLAPAWAQEVAPELLALARKYVDLTDRSSIYEVTLVETALETRKVLLSQSPDQATSIDAAINSTLEGYKGHKGDLLDQFARVYALRFTMAELQQIVDFYSSPVGTKLASTNAELNNDIQRIVQVFTNNVRSEFFAKVRAALKAPAAGN